MKIILLSKSLAVSGACWCGDVAAAKVGTSVNESASARAKEREKNDQHKICHQQTHTHTQTKTKRPKTHRTDTFRDLRIVSNE